MGNPYRDSLGRFSSGVGGGSRAKRATSPAKRMAGSGREVATIGNETMVMSKKDTPEQTRSKVAAAGARAKLRRTTLNPSRGVSNREMTRLAESMSWGSNKPWKTVNYSAGKGVNRRSRAS
jgi:hypothetical protein